MTDTTSAELLFRPATELAALVRSGEVSARELVDTSLARIAELNDSLNAFILVDEDGAREAADAVKPGDDRPFAGVPIAIKDIAAAWAGKPMTFGAELFGDFTPPFDSAVVRRIKDAGFIPVGKTNVPEFGLVPVTEPRRYGATRNPWNTDHTPGGSSGGSAAATAAGMVPIAHGNDGGGSIRIPAACCGLVGLKSARGRVSLAPALGEHLLNVEGVLTRTVEDTAVALDVLAGYEIGDANWAPPPAEPFASAVERDPGRLRVAWTLLPPAESEVAGESERAVRRTAELLDSLGHDVEEADPPWRNEGLVETFLTAWAVAGGMTAHFGGMVSGREPSEELMEPLSWEMYRRGRETSAYESAQAIVSLQLFARQAIAWQSQYDVLVCPTLNERPVAIGEIDTSAGMAAFDRTIQFTSFTAVTNVSGQPAISLPLLHGDDGLPTAVQIIGRPAGEYELLSLAAQIERAMPWADRRPPVG